MIKNLKNIKSLYLISGTYLLGDKKNGKLLLNVNYSKDGFDSIPFGASRLAQKEAKLLAKDLIKRKSRINLVE